MPLIVADHLSLAFGHLPLLRDASVQIDAGERIAIVGRNGTGKSSLLKILAGDLAPDAGTVWRGPGVKIARLAQDVIERVTKAVTVREAIAEGLHDAAGLDDWEQAHRIEQVMSRLGLEADAHVETLSGGWRRRVTLAQALVVQPDVWLLDEPTNHLDIDAIAWLEKFLAACTGAVVLVTHDRAFLQQLATRLIELDRGGLTSYGRSAPPTGTPVLPVYEDYLRRKEEALAAAETAHKKFDKLLAQEEAWLRRGIKARRTRDEGRVKALMAMRSDRAARRDAIGSVRLTMDSAERSGKVVFEVKAVSKSYARSNGPGVQGSGEPEVHVIRDFSTRIMRGDRIGVLGPNGSGKTTLLKLLVGELAPDSGRVEIGTHVQVAYYDQQREQLDPERTVVDTVADGNDTVTVGGRTRHVHGYLEDFLFPPALARSPVKALSGGERNRLLLARLFTRPANVLVLDEPTNDLDLETLELLEARLVEFPGTVLLVSHDREFLNHVVTSTLAFEGDGVIREYVGGYDDWLHQRPEPGTTGKDGKDGRRGGGGGADRDGRDGEPARRRLSYKDQRELDALPARIEALESRQRDFEATVAGPEFYLAGAEGIKDTLAQLDRAKAELDQLLARWTELEDRRT